MKTLISALSFLLPLTAYASPIYISPGQCILVGSQQVCATKVDATSAESRRILHVCRYDDFKNTEVSALKSYALIEVMIKDDGVKVETILKNFGNSGKQACEKALAEIKAEQKVK